MSVSISARSLADGLTDAAPCGQTSATLQLLTNSEDGFKAGNNEFFTFVSPGMLCALQYEDAKEELLRCACVCAARVAHARSF
jgi:hypothetical protein